MPLEALRQRKRIQRAQGDLPPPLIRAEQKPLAQGTGRNLLIQQQAIAGVIVALKNKYDLLRFQLVSGLVRYGNGWKPFNPLTPRGYRSPR